MLPRGRQVLLVGSLVVRACDPHPHAWGAVTRVRQTGANPSVLWAAWSSGGGPGVPPEGRQLAYSAAVAGVRPSVCAGPEGDSSSGTGEARASPVEAMGQLARSGSPPDSWGGTRSCCCVVPKLEAGTVVKELAVTDRVLTVLGQLPSCDPGLATVCALDRPRRRPA